LSQVSYQKIAQRAMLEITSTIQIPLDEFEWTFVRAGGPGGQNVNKVASKAVLRWNIDASPSVSDDVKARFRAHERRRIAAGGELIIVSQKYRTQELNRQDCLEKLRSLLRQAAVRPKLRRPTKPSRAAHFRRLHEKRRRAKTKERRRAPGKNDE
jgi:ribosome-associated protein